MSRKHTRKLLLLTTIVWVAVVIGAFWWLEFRYWRSFSDEQLAVFQGAAILQLPESLRESGKATVIHFTDPVCPCTRFTRAHLDELAADLSPTRQYVLPRQAGAGTGNVTAGVLDLRDHAAAATLRANVPASPAVGIWDKHGKLAYFGPYSSGPVCGSGRSFVTSTLDALKAGENPYFINTDATGCFCSWQPMN